MGQIDSDAYQHVRAVEGVRGSRLPAGRRVALRRRHEQLTSLSARVTVERPAARSSASPPTTLELPIAISPPEQLAKSDLVPMCYMNKVAAPGPRG